MPRSVHVSAPSRLHFGLMSLGGSAARQYGGVGAMVERPGLQLRLTAAAAFGASGPLAGRARKFAGRWSEFFRMPLPACNLEVLEAPPEHVGLGVGTQLGLSVAAALSAWGGMPALSAAELALCAGRALRSAVGAYGFVAGGLIVEQGKLPGEPVSPLDCRIDLPPQWRFLLVRPQGCQGLSGDEEAAAIDSLPAISAATTASLVREARERLVPAAATGDYAAFADSLYRYGHEAGGCFARRQGGPFNGPVLAALVEQIRGLGFPGVGQSSWGPTIFAICPSAAEAARLTDELQAAWTGPELDIVATAPSNGGARVMVET